MSYQGFRLQSNSIPNPKSTISRKTSESVHTSTLNEFDKDRLFFGKGITNQTTEPALKSDKPSLVELPQSLKSKLSLLDVLQVANSSPDHANHHSKPVTQQALPALFISQVEPSLAIECSTTTKVLAKIGQNLPKPKAIIVMSTGWQSSYLEVSNAPRPETWHRVMDMDDDFYRIEYPASGYPRLAESLAEQLITQGIHCLLNPMRAFDHGVWIPLKHIYPQADIPIIQISVPTKLDTYAGYQLGAMLAGLRNEGILLIGSGSLTAGIHDCMLEKSDIHDVDNMGVGKQAKSFKDWLIKQLKTDIPRALDWQSFEDFCKLGETSSNVGVGLDADARTGIDKHLQHSHLLPLFFVLGTGQRVSIVHQSLSIQPNLVIDILRFD